MLSNYRDMLKWPNNIKNEKFIIHNDIDGIISGMFLHNKGAEICGVYDLYSFNTTKKEYINNAEQLIGIDLDLNYRDMRCFGHHIVADLNKNGFNINNFMNLDISIKDYFTQKCPLNTIILLYSLFDLKPKNDREIAMLVYPDSVIKNYLTPAYKENVINWLKILKQEEIINALENRIDILLDIISQEIVNKIKDVFPHKSNHLQNLNNNKRVFPQCHNYINNKTGKFIYDINILIETIDKMMGWETKNFPRKFLYKKIFYKNETYEYNPNKKRKEKVSKIITFKKEDLPTVKERLKVLKNLLVSHSFTYKGGLQITTTEDIFIRFNSEKKDFDVYLKGNKNIIKITDKKTGKVVAYQSKTSSFIQDNIPS